MTTEINKIWPGINLNVTEDGVLGPDSSKPDPDYIKNTILMDPAGIAYFRNKGLVTDIKNFIKVNGIAGLSESIYKYLIDNGEVLPEKPSDIEDLFYHKYESIYHPNYDIKIIHLFSPKFAVFTGEKKSMGYKINDKHIDYSNLNENEIIKILSDLYFKLFDEYLNIVESDTTLRANIPTLSFCPISSGNYKPNDIYTFNIKHISVLSINNGFIKFLQKNKTKMLIIKNLHFNLCINGYTNDYLLELNKLPLDIPPSPELGPLLEPHLGANEQANLETKPETHDNLNSAILLVASTLNKKEIAQPETRNSTLNIPSIAPPKSNEPNEDLNSAILLVASTLNSPEIVQIKPHQVIEPIEEIKPPDNSLINPLIVAPPKLKNQVSREDKSPQLKLLDTIEDKNIPEAKNLCDSIKEAIIKMKEKISRISVIKIPDIDIIISNLKNLIININIIIRLSNKLNIETLDEFKPEELSFETFEKLNITLEKLLTKIDINPVAESKVIAAGPKVVKARPNKEARLESTKEEVNNAILLVASESKEDGVKAVAESKEGTTDINGKIIYHSKFSK
jgi:hypothetical protein